MKTTNTSIPNNRREFLKTAAILSGAAGLANVLPTSIAKAASINPDLGTTFYDAEHIVFLMQENRSFDHLFGSLQGVRGFHNPRIKQLPDGNKAWIQKDKAGNAYVPFHIDIHKTKITWQGGLPHSWKDQSLARNGGKYDQWIPHKTGLCMGYYQRSDVPFYYALADAFTICDHHFCSSLTGTTPNRLFFWTGNIRPNTTQHSKPAVLNSQAESRNDVYVDWKTFPEILEDNGIDWRIYQNELWTANLPDETDYWVGNYGDNAIEYVRRHHVELSAYFRQHGFVSKEKTMTADDVVAKYQHLSAKEKALVDRAFTTNFDENGDYLQLESYTFKDEEGIEQSIRLPKNDLFKQFRADVQNGKLPTVSWLVAPSAFSDHTSTPLYGTWYVSEALKILTDNPEVWKKTIFILTYDENDGYYDHLAPFVVPKKGDPNSGKTTSDIDTESDFSWEHDWPIGLGYRVPFIVASPWSKGGFVNSEVIDHTSTLIFLEKFLTKKTGKKIHCDNISSWRRAICGDLSSVFKPYNGEEYPLPESLQRNEVVQNIVNAKNKPEQGMPAPLSASEIEIINKNKRPEQKLNNRVPTQEKGTRPANALPYLLSAECKIENQELVLQFKAADKGIKNFDRLQGAAFNVYTPTSYKNEAGKCWNYAVSAGKSLEDKLSILSFANQQYDVVIDGPNGFHRRFSGCEKSDKISVEMHYEMEGILAKQATGNIKLKITNHTRQKQTVKLIDNAYGLSPKNITLLSLETKTVTLPLKASHHWYDLSVLLNGDKNFLRHYAGHAENGEISSTDPQMG